jgi:glycosyltransferase involved in cell wall biosynthesis
MEATVEISLLVWVYNEEKFLRKLHDGLLYEIGKLQRTFEIVYVDDGSTDSTPDALKKLKTEAADKVRIVTLRRPFGRAAVLAAGLANAKGKILVGLDATGEIPSNAWPRLVEEVIKGGDYAVGRQPDRRHPLPRWAASWLYSHVVGPVTGLRLHDMYTGVFACRREVLQEIMPVPQSMHWFLPLLAHRLGYDVREEMVAANVFAETKRGWLASWFDGLVDLLYVIYLAASLKRPIPVFAALGVVLAVAAAGFGLLTLLQYLLYGVDFGTIGLFAVALGLLGIGLQTLIVGLAAEAAIGAVSRSEPYSVKNVD